MKWRERGRGRCPLEVKWEELCWTAPGWSEGAGGAEDGPGCGPGSEAARRLTVTGWKRWNVSWAES